MSVIPFAEIGGGAAGGMSRDVHFEAEMRGILARRVDGAPVRLAAMDGVVAVLPQEFDERHRPIGVVDALGLADAVVVPVGWHETVVLFIGRRPLFERPVGHPMAHGIGPRHHAAPARRADGARIGLREEHALCRQPLHIGRLIPSVQFGRLRPERHRRVLPAHVVHHEEDDVGPFSRLWVAGPARRHDRGGRGGRQQERIKSWIVHCRYFEVKHPAQFPAFS